MSDTSERRLQKALSAQGYYNLRTPGSGTGVINPETGERHDHPDVVAISNHDSHIGSDVIVAEDKHEASYPVYIDPDQYDALVAVAQQSGGYPVFAVQIKNTRYPHDFHTLPITDRTDSGNYALREDGHTINLTTLTNPTKRPIATP